MRATLFFLVILLSINIQGQSQFEYANTFVRVFGMEGNKIAKGKILSISDTELILKRGKKIDTIYINNINLIRTKRSLGHNVLIGLGGGLVFGTLFGLSSGGIAGGVIGAFYYGIMGVPAGLLIGTFSVIFKNTKTYEINGKPNRMKAFKEGKLKPYRKVM